MDSKNDSCKISGEQGSVKPEETLTDIVRQVAFTRADGERGAMRAAANGAFIIWLHLFATSEVEDDREILEFALNQQGFDSWDEFTKAFHEAGEPKISPHLQKLDLGEDDLQIQGDVAFDLQEPEGDQDG